MRKIHFKNIELLKVNKYYFSKSETIEASALYENKKVPVIIKVQRFNKNNTQTASVQINFTTFTNHCISNIYINQSV